MVRARCPTRFASDAYPARPGHGTLATIAPAKSEMSLTDSYYTNVRDEMLAFVPLNAANVLDIGCGAGAFGAALKRERGAKAVTGIELDCAAASAARSQLDSVLVGDVSTILPDLRGQTFDVVVLNDVLEHLVDPEGLLNQLHGCMTRDGRVVASIPNVREFTNVRNLVLRGRWDYTDEGILDRTHLRFYTRASLDGLFERGGFAVETVQGINRRTAASFIIFNIMTLGFFADMGFLQYACVARRQE